MKARLLTLSVLALVVTACPRKGGNFTEQGAAMPVKLTTKDEVVRYLDEVFTTSLKWQAIACPPDQTGQDVPGTVQHCFTSMEEPEALLPKISGLMAKWGQKKMQWRQDFGFWVSTYNVRADVPYGVLVSLVAPGLNVALREDPKLKDFGTVAWFIVGNDAP